MCSSYGQICVVVCSVPYLADRERSAGPDALAKCLLRIHVVEDYTISFEYNVEPWQYVIPKILLVNKRF